MGNIYEQIILQRELKIRKQKHRKTLTSLIMKEMFIKAMLFA